MAVTRVSLFLSAPSHAWLYVWGCDGMVSVPAGCCREPGHVEVPSLLLCSAVAEHSLRGVTPPPYTVPEFCVLWCWPAVPRIVRVAANRIDLGPSNCCRRFSQEAAPPAWPGVGLQGAGMCEQAV